MVLCVCCGNEFVIDEELKGYYHSLGFEFYPDHCSKCFARKLAHAWEVPGQKKIVECSICGIGHKVSFVPSKDRPIFCNKCYLESKRSK
ncbi:MAG: hypothetical protein Kow0029_21950 [Candidatus Rifleibacteriota bacterium]